MKELREKFVAKINDFDAVMDQDYNIKHASDYAYLRADLLTYFDQLVKEQDYQKAALIDQIKKKKGISKRYGFLLRERDELKEENGRIELLLLKVHKEVLAYQKMIKESTSLNEYKKVRDEWRKEKTDILIELRSMQEERDHYKGGTG